MWLVYDDDANNHNKNKENTRELALRQYMSQKEINLHSNPLR